MLFVNWEASNLLLGLKAQYSIRGVLAQFVSYILSLWQRYPGFL